MTNIVKQQVQQLSTAVGAFAAVNGEVVVQKMEAESKLMLYWLHYLNASQRTGVANELLDGGVSSIREAAACAALGLVRPALFSIRMHIDLLLAWLYFKDHPIEWVTLNEFGDGFKMKRELLEYFSDNFKGFKARFSLLKDVATRSTEDPYRLLSAHVHAQSAVVLPTGANLSDVVQDATLGLQCADIWREVSEYVSDILVALYGLKWAAIPNEIAQSVEQRLGTKKGYRERFFGDI